MGFDSYDEDRYRAEQLQSAFRQFVWAFLEEDAGSTCRNLLNGEVAQFKGGNVNQKPEEFTQNTIVDGVLNALGYEIKHHPVELVKDERKQPDVKLRNLSDQCVGIVECKAIGREESERAAIKSLKERYLETNAFAQYKKTLEMRYLVGIATDGFDWKLRIKDLEADEILSDFKGDYSLLDSKGIHHCYYSEIHEETKTHWPTIREELAEDFVSTFGIHNLPGNH